MDSFKITDVPQVKMINDFENAEKKFLKTNLQQFG